METVFASVENCLGVAMLDEWGQNINSPGIQFVELDSMNPVYLAWNTKSDTSAIQVLKMEMQHYFRSQQKCLMGNLIFRYRGPGAGLIAMDRILRKI